MRSESTEVDVFALFNLGLQEMIVLGGCALFIVTPAVVLAIVLPMMLRKKRPIEPDDDGRTPLERARDAAAGLTPEERDALRRSLEKTERPPPPGDEGITS